jgi:hypothetical protein
MRKLSSPVTSAIRVIPAAARSGSMRAKVSSGVQILCEASFVEWSALAQMSRKRSRAEVGPIQDVTG